MIGFLCHITDSGVCVYRDNLDLSGVHQGVVDEISMNKLYLVYLVYLVYKYEGKK